MNSSKNIKKFIIFHVLGTNKRKNIFNVNVSLTFFNMLLILFFSREKEKVTQNEKLSNGMVLNKQQK